ncbi:MAG TPA: hypothetical protein VG502_04020 [Flexivirga sp.]|uniref:hypothetical protein n=1 Tax=Flexivirga sp. TaxID=1962927 RepID=UPI002CAD44C2|nr:hypothetical protein [Flexivirga sp.]HWC21447.1 hypothetical protein [Flexivirga sp.]
MTASPARPLALATAAVLVAVITGCSGSGSGAAPKPTTHVSVPTTVPAAPTPTPSTSAAAGSIRSSDSSFSLVAPTGWKKLVQKPATLAVKAPSPQDKVTTNFNVIVQNPQPVPALDDVVTQAEIAWRQQGVHIKDKPDRTIGGLPARGYTFNRKAQGASFTQTQYFVVFRSHVYSMTMTSASSADAAAGAEQALTGIFSTWAWKQH